MYGGCFAFYLHLPASFLPKKSATKQVGYVHDALPYAKLSKEIYNHDKEEDAKSLEIPDDDGNVWVRRLSERGVLEYTYSYEECLSPSGMAMSTTPIIGMKGECRTKIVPITKTGRSGFHAEFYTSGNDGAAIVFRGTDLNSILDWGTDITSLLLYPKQFSIALDFVTKVISSEQCKGNKCKNIVVTGHSLGGALAQYVALSWGLKGYVFNSLGLGKKTRISFDPNMANKAEIIGFVGQGYRNGSEMGIADFIEKVGKQFYKGPLIEVPINVPLSVRRDEIVRIRLIIHAMKNIYSSMRDMDSVYTKKKLLAVILVPHSPLLLTALTV